MSTSPLVPPDPGLAADAPMVPMFVCAGCRSEPLPYALITLGDGLEEAVPCPRRELCTWYVAHDLGGTVEYNAQPSGAQLPAAFRLDPYFSCPNFNEYDRFLARSIHA